MCISTFIVNVIVAPIQITFAKFLPSFSLSPQKPIRLLNCDEKSTSMIEYVKHLNAIHIPKSIFIMRVMLLCCVNECRPCTDGTAFDWLSHMVWSLECVSVRHCCCIQYTIFILFLLLFPRLLMICFNKIFHFFGSVQLRSQYMNETVKKTQNMDYDFIRHFVCVYLRMLCAVVTSAAAAAVFFIHFVNYIP